jgi:hypothetical protein
MPLQLNWLAGEIPLELPHYHQNLGRLHLPYHLK